jgi:flagellar protein FliS
MFASAFGSSVSKRQAGAYRDVLVSTGVNSASAHGLIGMLYDGLLGAIAEARGGMRKRDMPVKHKAISRAMRIVDEGLNDALNVKDGGALAADLRNLYNYINLRLTQANLKNDEAALDECVNLVETLRSAWAQIADAQPA